ncbi:hypothetical protein HOLleu_07244 [Holothuria leucospilota]|uniref:Neurotransmitter-gated ion-channel transmembrane domain-containing protein n=1 Tax=Holothuria leucospilota TaxID=206669 RepID=A0A9Q1CFV9_HOLLE|nr:hypothetical protein HOLleu_07244 [Holothuria leucospilota]
MPGPRPGYTIQGRGQPISANAYYFLVVIAISFLSVFATSLTLRMYHNDGTRPLPKLLRRLLLMKRREVYRINDRSDTSSRRKLSTQRRDIAQNSTSFDEIEESEHKDDNVFVISDRASGGRSSRRNSKDGRNSVRPSHGLKPLKGYNQKAEFGKQCNCQNVDHRDEWKRAAMRIDKCLFYVSLFTMIFAYFVCVILFIRTMQPAYDEEDKLSKEANITAF